MGTCEFHSKLYLERKLSWAQSMKRELLSLQHQIDLFSACYFKALCCYVIAWQCRALNITFFSLKRGDRVGQSVILASGEGQG